MATTSSTSSSRRTVLLGAWRSLVVSAAALFLVMGTLEVVLRTFDDFGYNGPDQIRRGSVGDGLTINYGRPWYRREFETTSLLNKEGYRWTSFAADAGARRRVAVLGDSYVQALRVPIASSLVAVAQSYLEDTQMLALGSPGTYVSEQQQFVTGGDFDELFGRKGRYAGVDAIVVCTRMWGVTELASGSESVAGARGPLGWRRSLKETVAAYSRRILYRGLRSSAHSVSYVSSRGIEWVAADLRNELHPLTSDRIDLASALLGEQVIPDLVEKATNDGIPIGFIYLPSIGEVAASSPDESAEHMVSVLAASGVPWIDVRPAFDSDTSLFFEYDHHPNAQGHAIMGFELARLVRLLLNESD